MVEGGPGPQRVVLEQFVWEGRENAIPVVIVQVH